MSKTLEERAAILEQALAAHLNIDLSAFDPQEAVAARTAALSKAREDAVATLTHAVDEAVQELSIDQRFARLEHAVTSAIGREL